MQQASARFRLPDGSVETLYAGDLIGRTWAAAVRIDDPDVSEAHAMVSLRGERLWLLALRRRFTVGGKVVEAVPLVEGARIRLAPGVELVCERTELPDHVLGLEGPGLSPQVLPGTCSLVEDPRPRLASGRFEDALAVFWLTEGRWRGRVEGEVFDLRPGAPLPGAAGAWRAVRIPIAAAGLPPTRADDAGPLRIVCSFDTVQIHRPHGAVVVIGGQLARVLSELATAGQPLAWEALARPHWPHIDDRDVLRRRWDGLLNRVRERLRDEGLRADLLVSSGAGLVELVLHEGDVVEDRG